MNGQWGVLLQRNPPSCLFSNPILHVRFPAATVFGKWLGWSLAMPSRNRPVRFGCVWGRQSTQHLATDRVPGQSPHVNLARLKNRPRFPENEWSNASPLFAQPAVADQPVGTSATWVHKNAPRMGQIGSLK